MKIIGKVNAASDVKPPSRAFRVVGLVFDVPRGRAWANLTDCYGTKEAIKLELPCCIERVQLRDVVEVSPYDSVELAP